MGDLKVEICARCVEKQREIDRLNHILDNMGLDGGGYRTRRQSVGTQSPLHPNKLPELPQCLKEKANGRLEANT